MWYVRDVLYAVLYVRVSCFVVRGCGVSRRYIDVCYCDMFSAVNVYHDHLKFCVACINSRRYVCCSECDVVSNEYNEPTFCLVQPIGAQSSSSLQTTSSDAKPTQHIEITHPNNVNLKLAFHKVASFHPHYLTFTPQTYHHPVHRLWPWPMQTTSQSQPHTQVRVQPRNTYNHTYTKFLPGQNKTTSY